MAENESLDIRVSRRWTAFLRAFYGREAPDVAGERFVRTLKSGWKKAQQQLIKHGTSLEEVSRRALNQDDLEPLYGQTKRHDYVRLFDIERRPFDSAEALLERVVSASAERVLNQIRHHVLGTDLCPDIGAWNDYQRRLLQPVAGQIAQFARSLAANPAARIRLPAMPPSDRPAISSGSFVHLSLLNPVSPVSSGARQ